MFKSKKHNIAFFSAVIILFVAGTSLLFTSDFIKGLELSRFLEEEFLRNYIANFGVIAPVAYILFQALQVVIAPFPGELTGSIAGALFGGGIGTLYATAGLALGGSIAFLFGRYLSKPLLMKMIGEKALNKYSFASNEKRNFVILIVFLIPGFPKDILTYLFAFGKVQFWTFFVLSQIGRLPGTIALTYFASAAIERDWRLVGGISVAVILVVLMAYVKRAKIQKLLAKY